MAIRFDPKHMHRLDSPERRKILPPEEILHKLDVTVGEIFIDIGCGTGYFTIPASKIVGSQGRVIAVDTSIDMINELNNRISVNNITNIEVIRSQTYGFPIPDRKGTFAFMSNVLHEVEDKTFFLKEANRILREGGRLAIIEWEKKETKNGPPIEDRLGHTEVRSAIEKAGFRFETLFTIGDSFVAYSAVKQ